MAEVRTVSLLVIAILAFRVLFTAAPMPVLMYEGGVGVVPLSLGLVSLTLSTIMIVLVARGVDLARGFGLLLGIDLMCSCAVGLSSAALPPTSSFHAVLWFPFHGTVMLWTVLLGVAWGVASIAVGVGLFAAQFTSRHLHQPDLMPLLLSHTVWLTLPLGVAIAATVLLRRIVHAVLAHGVRVGRSHGHVQMSRTLHDTVLQTLESIAMRPDGEREASNERLSELRSAAARQAAELRQLLVKPSPEHDSQLANVLRELVAECAGRGLRVELVLGDLPDETLLALSTQAAIGEATREALLNVTKHAGVSKVVVSARTVDSTVEVIIRDRGRGFEPAAETGFGIAQSMRARMREVGGTAQIWSEPGHGSRVRLSVPVEAP